MNNTRLGCLSPLAILSAVITLGVLVLIGVINGQAMFSPGALNAQPGSALGGVTSHAEIGASCEKCHAAPWTTSSMSERCLSCHSEVNAQVQQSNGLHGALLNGKSGLDCRACHTDHRGPDAALTILDLKDFPHDSMGFSMARHTLRADGTPIICEDCHTQGIGAFDAQSCEACHGQMDASFASAHLADFGSACLACHDGVDRYSNFEHNQTGFALAGKHLQAACAGCHPNTRAFADYANTPQACEGCHLADDAHAGSFGAQCGACHEPSGWENATFDHARAAFALDGAHVNVACADCHVNKVFKGTPMLCSGCHAEPEFHAGLFAGQECSTCHTTAAWRPGRYDGPHTFPMNHGEATSCADCHQPNLTTWTCYSCHDQGEIASKHQEEGIADFTDCLRCHANGQKEEGGDRGGGGGGDD